MTDQELLRTWMEMAGGLTQAQAAERLGLTQPGVNQVLNGKCNLSEVGRKFIAHLISDCVTQNIHDGGRRMIDLTKLDDALRRIMTISAENLPNF